MSAGFHLPGGEIRSTRRLRPCVYPYVWAATILRALPGYGSVKVAMML